MKTATMKKLFSTVMMVCVTNACAMAAVAAFDSPAQEQAHYRQAAAQQAWMEQYGPRGYSESDSYKAVPAFDSPEQEAAYYEQAAEKAAWEEQHAALSYS